MISQWAPAKVNLFLQVLGKRPDGYHELATLMQKISLFDRVSFDLGGKGIRIECPGSPLPADETNIAYKAAAVFLNHIKEQPGIRIVIEKGIPTAAGLGGGSSDAATVLKSLNELLRCGLHREELISLGEKIGADVPFFLFAGTAWAFGKGERLEPAEDIASMWLVLVNPGFEVSTRSVYEGLKMGLTKGGLKFNIPKFFSIQDVAQGLRNDLERVTLERHPVLAEIKDRLTRCGALGALMSGSGPTVFGIFTGQKEAERAAAELKKAGNWSVFAVQSL